MAPWWALAVAFAVGFVIPFLLRSWHEGPVLERHYGRAELVDFKPSEAFTPPPSSTMSYPGEWPVTRRQAEHVLHYVEGYLWGAGGGPDGEHLEFASEWLRAPGRIPELVESMVDNDCAID